MARGRQHTGALLPHGAGPGAWSIHLPPDVALPWLRAAEDAWRVNEYQWLEEHPEILVLSVDSTERPEVIRALRPVMGPPIAEDGTADWVDGEGVGWLLYELVFSAEDTVVRVVLNTRDDAELLQQIAQAEHVALLVHDEVACQSEPVVVRGIQEIARRLLGLDPPTTDQRVYPAPVGCN